MHSQSKITIGIPVYNEIAYINQTLTSVLNQTYRNLEILISDNASTDGSSELCRSIAATDKRITYIKHKNNMGSAKNFKYIFENTNSEYIMWMGAHDLLSPFYIETQLAALEANNNLALAYSLVRRIDELGNHIKDTNGGDFLVDGKPITRYLKTVRGPWGECTAVNGVFRRRALKGAKFFTFAGPDHLLLTKAQYNGLFHRTEKHIYFRRQFRSTQEDYIQRIKGSTNNINIMTQDSCRSKYHLLCLAYLSDFLSLPENWPTKLLYLPLLLLNLELAYGFFSSIILAALPQKLTRFLLSKKSIVPYTN